MPIINRPQPEASAPEFLQGGDDYLKEYIAEIHRPKQQQTAPEIPDDSEFEPEEIEEIQEPSRYQQKRGKTSAQFAVSTLDKVLSSMVAVYANSDQPEDFKADQADLDDLADQLSVYFTENNLDLPPWVFALITAGFIIQKKFKGVGIMRKINAERKKYQVENESLKMSIEVIKQKNEKLMLEQKLHELEAQNKPDGPEKT